MYDIRARGLAWWQCYRQYPSVSAKPAKTLPYMDVLPVEVSDSSAYNLLSLEHSVASCYSAYNSFPLLLYIYTSAIIFFLLIIVYSLYNYFKSFTF
jgi:hypothetical protein